MLIPVSLQKNQFVFSLLLIIHVPSENKWESDKIKDKQAKFEKYSNGKFQCFIVPLVNASGSFAPFYFPTTSNYAIRKEN